MSMGGKYATSRGCEDEVKSSQRRRRRRLRWRRRIANGAPFAKPSSLSTTTRTPPTHPVIRLLPSSRRRKDQAG